MTLRLVECAIPILQQLEIEEALLRVGEGSWCILNHASPPAIVLGLFSSIEELVDIKKLQEKPLPLIRRFSGGGTVVVDENTCFFSLIVERKKEIHELMEWTGTLLAPVFSPNTLLVAEHDYVIHDKKIGGNAQSFTKKRALHHTSFLWSWEEERMRYLKNPPKQPSYREKRAHTDFCGKLSPYFQSKEEFFSKIIEALGLQFEIQRTSLEEASYAITLPHLKRLKVETKFSSL